MIAATVAGRVTAIAIGILYALAVAASRLYLGYHFPLDLVGAFLCALAAAFIVTGLAALFAVRIYLDRLTPAGSAAVASAPVARRGPPLAVIFGGSRLRR